MEVAAMKRLGLAFMLAGLLATAAASAAFGCTTKIPVYDKETVVKVVYPGVITQNGNVRSVRGMVEIDADASTSAFVAGKSTSVVNYDVDFSTGGGKIWGSVIKRPTAYPHGAWACHFSGNFTGGTWTAEGSCVGTGTLRGWRFTADLVDMKIFVAATGFVFRAGSH
jgi:hypothetical protein